MKSLFNYTHNICFTILLSYYCTSLWARQGIVITHLKKEQLAQKIKKNLIENFSIPATIIDIEWKDDPCRPLKNAILHICVGKENQMLFPWINRQELKESLLIFKEE